MFVYCALFQISHGSRAECILKGGVLLLHGAAGDSALCGQSYPRACCVLPGVGDACEPVSQM